VALRKVQVARKRKSLQMKKGIILKDESGNQGHGKTEPKREKRHFSQRFLRSKGLHHKSATKSRGEVGLGAKRSLPMKAAHHKPQDRQSVRGAGESRGRNALCRDGVTIGLEGVGITPKRPGRRGVGCSVCL